MGPEFFQTMMGRKFYEADVPRIAKGLERLIAAIEKQNELAEKQLAVTESTVRLTASAGGDTFGGIPVDPFYKQHLEDAARKAEEAGIADILRMVNTQKVITFDGKEMVEFLQKPQVLLKLEDFGVEVTVKSNGDEKRATVRKA
jgi:hypothetical protein